jgi:hypothetical protein
VRKIIIAVASLCIIVAAALAWDAHRASDRAASVRAEHSRLVQETARLTARQRALTAKATSLQKQAQNTAHRNNDALRSPRNVDGDLSDALTDQHVHIVGTLNSSARAISLPKSDRDQLANALRLEHRNVDDATSALASLEQQARPGERTAP